MPPASTPSDSKRLALTSSSDVSVICSGLRKTITAPTMPPAESWAGRALKLIGAAAAPSARLSA